MAKPVHEQLAEHRARADAVVKSDQTGVIVLELINVNAVDEFRRTVLPTIDDETARSLTIAMVSSASVDWRWWFPAALGDLRRRRIQWRHDDVALMLTRVPHLSTYELIAALKTILAAAERLEPAERRRLADRLQAARDRLDNVEGAPSERAKLRARLQDLLAPIRTQSDVDTSSIRIGDGWSRAAVQRLAAVTDNVSEISSLLAHAGKVSGSRPTGAWLKQAETVIGAAPSAVQLSGNSSTRSPNASPLRSSGSVGPAGPESAQTMEPSSVVCCGRLK